MIRASSLFGAVTFALFSLPCEAGPCAKDIELMQVRLDAWLDAKAAAGPSAQQSVGAQLHRQPTPGSIENTERKLGDLSMNAVDMVKAIMVRARKADADGDAAGCQSALAELDRDIGK